MNYAYIYLILILLLVVQVTTASPGKTGQQKLHSSQTYSMGKVQRDQITRLPLTHRLALKMVAKKLQKQQARPHQLKNTKSTSRYKYGALSLICLFVGLLMLIVVPIVSALGVGGAIYFGLLGLKRDPDPSLARVSLIALGILVGLALVLTLFTLIRVGGFL